MPREKSSRRVARNAGAAAFVDVVIPVTRLGEGNLQTDVGLDQLGDLLECLAMRRERRGCSA